jgi:hypothetical protein
MKHFVELANVQRARMAAEQKREPSGAAIIRGEEEENGWLHFIKDFCKYCAGLSSLSFYKECF